MRILLLAVYLTRHFAAAPLVTWLRHAQNPDRLVPVLCHLQFPCSTGLFCR
jgi:hypothetical protein